MRPPALCLRSKHEGRFDCWGSGQPQLWQNHIVQCADRCPATCRQLAGGDRRKKTGLYNYAGTVVDLVDLPGTYSLESSDDSVSLDEKVARDYVASRAADLIINIIDASNIERNLYLTSQLLEMRVPVLVALNMMDVVKQRGIKI